MKKLVLLIVALLVIPGMVFAQGAFDNTDTDLALPGKPGKTLCITDLAFDATNATDDINFYAPTGDMTRLTADVAAAATLMTLAGTTGIATNAQVIIQRADGTYAETKALSAISTANVATVGALDAAYKEGDLVYEVSAWGIEYANVGTAAVTHQAGGKGELFCAPYGQPLGAIIDAGLMIYMSGYYQ